MNVREFGEQMERLMDVYGERYYPMVRNDQIYKWAKRMTAEAFEQVVSNLIADCAHAPLLSKFQEAFSQVRSKMAVTVIHCVYCSGSGMIPDPESPPPMTAYACRCAAGGMVPQFVARWQGPWVRAIPEPHELVRNPDAPNVVKHAVKKMGDL